MTGATQAPPEPPVSLSATQEKWLLWTLAGIQFSHILDFTLMMPLGPMLIEALAISTREFALLVSAYSLSAGIAALLISSCIDRFERKRLLLGIFVLFIAATSLCALAQGYHSLLAARALAGAAGGILGAMVQTLVGDLIAPPRRGRATGIVMSAFSVAAIVGLPVSLSLASYFSWRVPFFFTAAVAALFLLLSLRVLPQVPVMQHGRPQGLAGTLLPMWQVLRQPHLLNAILFVTFGVFSAFCVTPFITLYLTGNVGIAAQDIALVYLCGGLATFFSNRYIGKLSDQLGHGRTFMLLGGFSVLAIWVQTNMPQMPLLYVVVLSLLFFVLIPGRSVPAMALVTALPSMQQRGAFMALIAAARQLASGSAAYLAGLLVVTGEQGQLQGFTHAGYLAIGVTLLTLWQSHRLQLSAQAVQPLKA